MNQSHIATIGAAGIAAAAVGVFIWLLGLCGVSVPETVAGNMEVIATAAGAYWFHGKGAPSGNPTNGQG